MGRKRKYLNAAEKQKAYRKRNAPASTPPRAEEEALRNEDEWEWVAAEPGSPLCARRRNKRTGEYK